MEAVKDQSSSSPVVGIMYFSPSGSTQKVCEEIARSISPNPPVRVDLTKISSNGNKTGDADLWIVGAPVYSMRLPAIARERISDALDNNGKKAPAVAIAVYGNVGVGIALKQLVDLLSEKGYKVIGAGAFIGEHTLTKYHGGKTEFSIGRPNEKDLVAAREFGAALAGKGLSGTDIRSLAAIQSAKLSFMLSHSDEKGIKSFFGPLEVDRAKCNECKICARSCPTNCIDEQTITVTSMTNCIYCGNCLKVCPTGAISQKMKNMWLLKLLGNQKEVYNQPVYYT